MGYSPWGHKESDMTEVTSCTHAQLYVVGIMVIFILQARNWKHKEVNLPNLGVHCLVGNDALEKEMATHSSILAWRIPGMREHGGLPSMQSHRVGHD